MFNKRHYAAVVFDKHENITAWDCKRNYGEKLQVIDLLVWGGVAWWSHFYWFLCIIFLLIFLRVTMNIHFSFRDWNCFWNFFLWSFDKLLHPGNMLFHLEKSKRVNGRKWTQTRQKEIVSISCLIPIASLFFSSQVKIKHI